MKSFGVAVFLSAISISGSLYYAHVCRESVFVANFQKDLADKENRIFRDEVNELRSRKTYQEGVVHTFLQQKFSNGFQDGMEFAYQNADPSIDYVKIYHAAVASLSANVEASQKAHKAEVHAAYENGIKDGLAGASAKIPESHDDFSTNRVDNE